jgi:uncharacterized membrane protein YhaH (DUF805 family)
MDWNWYLFCFEGRINRAKWWLSLPIVLGWLIFLLLMSILVARIVFKGPAVDIDIGIDEMFTLIRRATDHSLSRNDIVSLVTNFLGMPIVIWIILATSIKRLHDRDRSGWWIVPFFALPQFLQGLCELASRFTPHPPAWYCPLDPLDLGLFRTGFPARQPANQPLWPEPAAEGAEQASQHQNALTRDERLGPGERDRDAASYW